MKIKNLETGLVYRNSKPHVHSIHAYFPSVVVMKNRELLATIVLGEAFESSNCHTYVTRSTDNGETWRLEGLIYPGTVERLTSDTSRLTVLPDGEVVVIMFRHDRTQHPKEGLTKHETLGFVPTELLIFRSKDYGHTWIGPKHIDPPLVGPSFELCSPITPLKDGRWILPTSTWRGWNGDCPNGMKMIAFVSYDRGETWSEYMDVMIDPKKHVIYWESKIVELRDGRLLAVVWAYNEKEKRDLPNQYALSDNGGKTWFAQKSTGLLGQTLTPFLLEDCRILCVYRRMDKPGLWLNISRLDKEEWVNEFCEQLWGSQSSMLTGSSDNMAQNFNVLRFGAPCITRLQDKNIFVAFWCYEDCVSNIRFFKFQIV